MSTVTQIRLTESDREELDKSMTRHPAGKRQVTHLCPTCGHNPSGALGTPSWDRAS